MLTSDRELSLIQSKLPLPGTIVSAYILADLERQLEEVLTGTEVRIMPHVSPFGSVSIAVVVQDSSGTRRYACRKTGTYHPDDFVLVG